MALPLWESESNCICVLSSELRINWPLKRDTKANILSTGPSSEPILCRVSASTSAGLPLFGGQLSCCFSITLLKLSSISQELKNTEAAQSKVEAAQEQVFGQQGLSHI